MDAGNPPDLERLIDSEIHLRTNRNKEDAHGQYPKTLKVFLDPVGVIRRGDNEACKRVRTSRLPRLDCTEVSD